MQRRKARKLGRGKGWKEKGAKVNCWLLSFGHQRAKESRFAFTMAPKLECFPHLLGGTVVQWSPSAASLAVGDSPPHVF